MPGERIVSFNMQGYRDLLGRFATGSKEAKTRLRTSSRDIGRKVTAAIKKAAPVGTHYIIHPDGTYTETKPATLKKSIRFKTFQRKWGVDLRFYAASHVKFVIHKTKPHWIEAKRAKFLRFVWPDAPPELVESFGGNVMYFRRVWHPGTRANPFHERAILALEPEVSRALRQYAARVFRTMEG